MKLIDYMLDNSLGPSEMAKRVGVNHATIIRWRDGKRMPEPEMMRRLMTVTGGAVQPNDFFDLQDGDGALHKEGKVA